MPKRILILGATGLLGEPVAHQLKTDGFLVRVLARDVEKASQRLDHKSEIVQGDVTDIPSLNRPCGTATACISAWEGKSTE